MNLSDLMTTTDADKLDGHDSAYFLPATSNAASATKLATVRTIGLSGDVSGSASFDGTANATISATVANDSHTHDTMYFTEAECNNNFLGKTSKAADADKLDGADSATASTIDTIVKRDSSGDITAKSFKSEYDTTNSNINYVMTQIDTASDNRISPSTLTQLSSSMGLENTATTAYTVSTSVPSGGADGDTWYQV